MKKQSSSSGNIKFSLINKKYHLHTKLNAKEVTRSKKQLLHKASSAKFILCIVFFSIFSCRNSTFRMQQHKVQAIQKRKKNLRHEVTTAT